VFQSEVSHIGLPIVNDMTLKNNARLKCSMEEGRIPLLTCKKFYASNTPNYHKL